MIFYHGTDKHGLEETERQGYLLHKRAQGMSHCVYLAVDIEEARQYGDVLMRVEYDPQKNKSMNNYLEGCWQFRVYEPIYEWEVL